MPPKLAAMSDWGNRYYKEHGCCATCAELEIERKSGQRIVDENDQFVALMPFAAKHPFELWVVPKRQLSGPPDIAELLVRDYFVACTMR